MLGVGESGAVVLGGVARDRAGLGHRLADRRWREIGGAGGAFALAEIDGDAETTVALVLDGLDLAEPHRGVQPFLQAGIGLGLDRAAAVRLLECEGDHGLQFGNAAGVDGL